MSRHKSCSPLNRVLNDGGFVEKFGRKPSKDDADATRISAHLEHVERLLRASQARLSPEKRRNRARALDLLRGYREAAEFPRNTYQPGRLPVFVDRGGRTCAVGFLIRQTGQPGLTYDIAARQRLAYVEEIRDPRVLEWAETHGFTREELAMIQPTYEWGSINPQPVVYGALNLIHYGIAVSLPVLTAFAALWAKRVDALPDYNETERGRPPGAWLMAFVAMWGLAVAISGGLFYASNPTNPGLGWLAAKLAMAAFFVAVGLAGATERVPERGQRAARWSVPVFLGVMSVVCVVGVLPIGTVPCATLPEYRYSGPVSGTTFRTRIGLWLSIVSPGNHPIADKNRAWTNSSETNPQGLGLGRACPN